MACSCGRAQPSSNASVRLPIAGTGVRSSRSGSRSSRRGKPTSESTPAAGRDGSCWTSALRLDPLLEAEAIVGVVLRLDLGESLVVLAVVGLLPALQRRVDVVLVRLAGGEPAHRVAR